MKNFKKLIIWQKGMRIVDLTYKMTDTFPSAEKFGLSSQCQKAAVSIPSNIAEGSSRQSQKDEFRFMEIALGSSFELETQTLVAQMRNYSSIEIITELLNEIDQEQRMLMKYMEKIAPK
ncbi:MAG: four helix bundle protein [Saprospiraceae bacterium]|nr:four helix bundle protein [Saprospiraceae bacterium]